VVDILGNWVTVVICGLFVIGRTAGEFLIVLFSDAVLLDAEELLSESRS